MYHVIKIQSDGAWEILKQKWTIFKSIFLHSKTFFPLSKKKVLLLLLLLLLLEFRPYLQQFDVNLL